VLNRKEIITKMLYIQQILTFSPLEHLDLLIFVMAVTVFGIYTYTFYNNIFNPTITDLSTLGLRSNKNLRLLKLSLSSIGAVVPYGNANTNDNFVYEGATTVVELSDAELNELLQIVFAEIGNSTSISVELLKSLGLYTPTVISYLESLGYIIS
jgi:hypothetical protein